MQSDEATFSSPRTADLNGDGVLDIVQGFGQDTFGARESSVIATDGATGGQLWKTSGFEDLVGSATFIELNADEVDDIVINGRRGALVALDGATGTVLWQFDDQGGRWFNFTNAQVVPDQNGDGQVDIVVSNGGLRFDGPEEGTGLPSPDDRHLGTIFLVSGADGSVVESVPVPDRGESYMTPLVLPGPSGLDVIIGTGGETVAGSLWTLPLEALVSGDRGAFIELLDGGAKGFIAAPSAADFTGDCVLDLVVQSFDGTISLIDRASGGAVWQIQNPGDETYTSPTLGYFTGDDEVPDVVTSVARGVWPEYASSDYLLIDGVTGAVEWRETLGTFAPSGLVAADLNGDGRDEAIFGVNDPVADIQRVLVLDTARRQTHELMSPLPQTTFASLWLGDIDDDRQLDLIATESAYQSAGSARVHRFVLPWPTPQRLSWAGYLGTDGDGVLHGPPSRFES